MRTIPDSVEEFTGFCKGKDLTGGDFLGYGSANHFKASGTAVVRNVWLPAAYQHGTIPDTRHLLKTRRSWTGLTTTTPTNEAGLHDHNWT